VDYVMFLLRLHKIFFLPCNKHTEPTITRTEGQAVCQSLLMDSNCKSLDLQIVYSTLTWESIFRQYYKAVIRGWRDKQEAVAMPLSPATGYEAHCLPLAARLEQVRRSISLTIILFTIVQYWTAANPGSVYHQIRKTVG
jgi:hypothetical protein